MPRPTLTLSNRVHKTPFRDTTKSVPHNLWVHLRVCLKIPKCRGTSVGALREAP